MENTTPSLDTLLNEHFQGKVVRKDLTKLLKEGVKAAVVALGRMSQLTLRIHRSSHAASLKVRVN